MANKKKSSFMTDFKNFITRGNVLDMAVGVIIGAAFGAIVTGLVNYVLNPIIGLFTGGVDLDNVKTILVPEVSELDAVTGEMVVTQKEVAIMWGLWIQTIINFIIVALCIFIIVRAVTKLRERLEAKKTEAARIAAEAEAAKAAEEKAAADAAAAEAAAAAAERQKQLEDSILRQEKLLEAICESVKK
ncbi:MAG: large conductance mechanosensitive channel protein MscL [Clostridia bacterium]|nr:large conductance mechanosensitive channel protein MscL [Clostridia bacterium]